MKKNYKKVINIFVLAIMVSIIFMPNVMALNYDSPCSDDGVRKAMQILGYVIFIAKIIAPLILIVIGMMDFSKAVTSSDEKALRKAIEALVRRLIAAVFVLLAPTLLLIIVNTLDPTDAHLASTEQGTFHSCTRCLLDPNDCK